MWASRRRLPPLIVLGHSINLVLVDVRSSDEVVPPSVRKRLFMLMNNKSLRN